MRDNPEPGDKSGEIQKFFHGEVGKIACIFIPVPKKHVFFLRSREGSFWSQDTSLLWSDYCNLTPPRCVCLPMCSNLLK